MTDGSIWPWVALLLLGAYHGINPGMGWLFAVALGMQERSGRAVWRTLPPLALGHALAIGGVILLVVLAGLALPLRSLKWPLAAVLLALGLYRLASSRHPRWGGMRVGARDLTIWSFIMASAHGAGLMVLPVFVALAAGAPGAGASAHHFSSSAAAGLAVGDEPLVGLLATLVHTAAYLSVTGLIATLVYQKLGLARLRTAWVNLDLIWAFALIATGGFTLLL